jgi:carbonic anhydrase/acetyltransferase-like protein (isoleucine patch superfamily)
LLKLLNLISHRIGSMSSNLYVGYLRRKGVRVGEGTVFFSGSRNIDVTRPYLVEIGRNCVFTEGVQVLTHGFDWSVLREKYGEVLCSSGKVSIGDNVFIGVNAVILKGVRIGENTIIGAGSVVTHDIPANCVAAGNPCKVIMSIDEYYKRRKLAYVEEAKAYAFEIFKKTGKIPRREDFLEEFPIFIKRDEEWIGLPVNKQLGPAFAKFMETKPVYSSFKEFLIAAGIPKEKLE